MTHTKEFKSGLYDCGDSIGRRREGGKMDWIEIRGSWFYDNCGDAYISYRNLLALPEEYLL